MAVEAVLKVQGDCKKFSYELLDSKTGHVIANATNSVILVTVSDKHGVPAPKCPDEMFAFGNGTDFLIYAGGAQYQARLDNKEVAIIDNFGSLLGYCKQTEDNEYLCKVRWTYIPVVLFTIMAIRSEVEVQRLSTHSTLLTIDKRLVKKFLKK